MPDDLAGDTLADKPSAPPEPAPVGSRAVRNSSGTRWLSGLLIGVLGVAILAQLSDNEPQRDFTGVRGAELVEMLKSLDVTNRRLVTQIDELTAIRDDLLTNTRSTKEAEKAARDRADAMAVLAGLAAATGPGIQITITAPSEAVTAAVLLDAIHEMRDAGAEAIALNGVVRVVSSTWFVDDDRGVRAGGRVLQPPYVLEVIGDPDTLANAATFRGGLVDRVSSRGGTVDVQKRDQVTVTVLADELEFEYARRAD